MISGNSIDSLMSANNINLSTDYFLVSTRDKYIKDVFNSKCSRASDMLKYIIYDVFDSLHLSSMSRHNVDEYSQRNHSHDDKYSNLSINYIYPEKFPDGYPLNPVDQSMDNVNYKFNGYPIEKAALSNSISIGNMFVDGLLSTTYIPMSCCYDFLTIPWQMTEPNVGEIKFVALNNIRNIGVADVLNDDFDGWLWLNNNISYSLTAFRLSNEIIDITNNTVLVDFIESTTGSGNNITFKLKNANDYFFKIDNSQPSLKYITGSIGAAAQHIHPIQFTVAGNAEITGQISVVQTAGDGGFLHTGTGKSSHIPKKRKSDDGYTYIYGYQEGTSFISSGTNIVDKEIAHLVCRRKDNNSNAWTQLDMPWQQIWEMDGNKATFSNIDISASCKLLFDNANVLNESEFVGETYPSYMLMPVMVYVGRRKDHI